MAKINQEVFEAEIAQLRGELAESKSLCAELLASAQADRELDNHYVHHQGCTTDCQVRANLRGGSRFLRVHALAKAEGGGCHGA